MAWWSSIKAMAYVGFIIGTVAYLASTLTKPEQRIVGLELIEDR